MENLCLVSIEYTNGVTYPIMLIEEDSAMVAISKLSYDQFVSVEQGDASIIRQDFNDNGEPETKHYMFKRLDIIRWQRVYKLYKEDEKGTLSNLIDNIILDAECGFEEVDYDYYREFAAAFKIIKEMNVE